MKVSSSTLEAPEVVSVRTQLIRGIHENIRICLEALSNRKLKACKCKKPRLHQLVGDTKRCLTNCDWKVEKRLTHWEEALYRCGGHRYEEGTDGEGDTQADATSDSSSEDNEAKD